MSVRSHSVGPEPGGRLRRRTAAVCIALAVLGTWIGAKSVAAAAPDSTAQIRMTLATFYGMADAALERHDVRGSFAFYDQTCRVVKPDGKPVSLNTLFNAMAQVLAAAEYAKSRTRILKCVVPKHGMAVVTAATASKIIYLDAYDQTESVESSGTSQDTWALTRLGWRIVTSRVISEHSVFNGEPFKAKGSKK
ncbi:MAG: hypothetical protein ACLQVD_11355 [Capsulimonadaceae bacterium]